MEKSVHLKDVTLVYVIFGHSYIIVCILSLYKHFICYDNGSNDGALRQYYFFHAVQQSHQLSAFLFPIHVCIYSEILYSICSMLVHAVK